MKISQSPQELIIYHRQPGRWMIAIACLAVGVAAALKTSIISEISCQRTATLSNCTLTYRSLNGLTSESGIQVESVYKSPICVPPQIGWTDCFGEVNVLETQRGKVYVLGMEADLLADVVNQFISQSNSSSLQLEIYGWSLNHPPYNLVFFILPFVMFILLSDCLRQEKIYRCQFNKSSGWVTISCTQFYGTKVVITELPIADIQTVDLRWFITNCLLLKLKSGKQVRVAEFLWIPFQTKRSLEKGRQVITEFLQ
ncbi:hypothetical protein H6F90_25165 [Trichocoleus sp. FACHB-591]|uniref:hypothetical protein n=1 Tax=Trichocoleus sp. FACHB-591 TaxID=2692872 RepID=UPI0016886443|nr:hypothetical protein [Trichocoleus sp. FACHB-591]MBD2098366.1 hypothetical protein [Trichocoleus sp. FACHB-591]